MMNEAHQFDQYSPDQMGHDYEEYPHGEVGRAGTAAEAPDRQSQIPEASEEAGQNAMPMQGYQVMETGESMMVEAGNVSRTKSVHQCPVCDKIFVSFKGLQQHAIIHTDQKPYACDICGKSFRFKSNLFEHRSVHTGNTPHRCPICGKTCRLKGNLKKHLRTHCSSKEELELAWQPFASNRRAPAEIPQDAIIIRPNTDTTQLFTPPNRPKKRKFGLGVDAKMWVEKIRRGDILPAVTIPNKMKRILDLVKMAEQGNMEMENLFIHARAIPIEQFDCPICKTPFYSRLECFEHIEQEHPNSRKQRPHFCDICLRSFNDRQQLGTHQEHHKRVQAILEGNEIKISEPMIMMPVINEADENEKAAGDGEDEEDGGSAGIIANDEDDEDWEHP